MHKIIPVKLAHMLNTDNIFWVHDILLSSIVHNVYRFINQPLQGLCYRSHTFDVLYKLFLRPSTAQTTSFYSTVVRTGSYPPPAYYPPLLFSFITMINGELSGQRGEKDKIIQQFKPTTTPQLNTCKQFSNPYKIFYFSFKGPRGIMTA